MIDPALRRPGRRLRVPACLPVLLLGASFTAAAAHGDEPPTPSNSSSSRAESALGGPPATAERPNVIFFLSDDQRHDFLGCAGHPVLQTPVIDRLAREGVRMTHAYVTTSICAASRATFFTGVVERTHGYTFGKPPVPADLVAASYPRQLRDAGYRTGFIGKFGVAIEGQPRAEWFDHFEPINRSPYFHPQEDGSLRHESDLCGDAAIRFIESGSADQPFCLSVSFNAAHAEDHDRRDHFPWPPEEDGLYDDVTVPGPRLTEQFDTLPDFLRRSMNRIRWHWRWDSPARYQRNVRGYYRMITGLDRNIGRVIEALEQQGIADKTVILFAGDNGYYRGDRGLAGKWSHFEESLRVPLVVYDPRLPDELRGRTFGGLTTNLDVAATIVDYAGLAPPPVYQGISLRGVMESEAPQWPREDFLCEHLMDNPLIPKWEGVHTGRYVYARYVEQQPEYEFLHDLEEDPDQLRNLVDDAEYGEVLAKLRTRTAQLVKQSSR